MRKLAYLYYLLLTMCLVSCVNDNDHFADDVDDIVENGSGVYGTLSSMEPVKQVCSHIWRTTAKHKPLTK